METRGGEGEEEGGEGDDDELEGGVAVASGCEPPSVPAPLPACCLCLAPPVPARFRGGRVRLRCPLPSSPASQRYTFLALRAVPKPSLTIPEPGGARPLRYPSP